MRVRRDLDPEGFQPGDLMGQGALVPDGGHPAFRPGLQVGLFKATMHMGIDETGQDGRPFNIES